MHPDRRRYQELASKWLRHTISDEEKEEFAAWYRDGQDNPVYISAEFPQDDDSYQAFLLQKINQVLDAEEQRKSRRHRIRYWCMTSAAMLCLAVGWIWYGRMEKSEKYSTIQNHSSSVETAARNRATLTLADGKTIFLDQAGVGHVADDGGSQILKSATGALEYQKEEKAVGKIGFNTLSTPLGGQFQVVLPDGTMVWLNAGSVLTFPTQFGPKERSVQLRGEAYFAVNKQAINRPFVVKTPKQEIYVMGTEFNIQAYADEELEKTTLVMGAVKVKGLTKKDTRILKPGQQARLGDAQVGMVVEAVDVPGIIAWKNGYFSFNDADIRDVMKQFARWYGLQVTYEGNNFNDGYVGKIPRSCSLEKALKVLKSVGLRYRMEGKTLIIMN